MASSETQGQSVGSGERARRKFQVRAKETLGTDSHRAISKNSSGCRLLIGHKKCFVLLCPIGEQFLLSSFREFVHDGYCFDHGLSGSCTKEMQAVRKLSVWYKIPIKYRESEKLGYWKRCKTVLRHWQKDIIEYKHHRVLSANLRVILGIWVHV